MAEPGGGVALKWPTRAGVGELGRRTRESLMTYIGLLIVLAGLIAFFAVSQSKFATYANLINILETNSVLLIVAVGLTFTLLAGGFDLSIGGVLALSGVLLARIIGYGVPAGLAIVIIVVGALLFGLLVNGLTIARLGLNFFVVTIGSLALTRGLALAASGGEVLPLYDETLIRNIGTYRVGDVPIPVIIAVVILVVAFLVTRYTGFGRMIYAVGGNAEAARLAGINVVGVRMAAYAICGALAGVAGVVETGRLASASPLTDQGIELTAAAAVLLGGTSFTGGIGSMVGTLLGVVFLGVLQNGLIISSIAVYWQGVITGVVLIASVLLDKLRRNRLAT